MNIGKAQKTFYWQVASHYIVLSIAISVVYFSALVLVSWNYLDVAKQRLHWQTAEYLALDIEKTIAQAGPDVPQLEKQLYAFSLLNPGIEPHILTADGTIVVSQYDDVRSIDVSPLQAFLATSDSPLRAIYGQNPRKYQRDTEIFSVAPLSLGSGTKGYLYLILRGEEWYAVYGMLGNYFSITLAVLAVLLCLFLGAVLGLRIVSRTSKRFQRMTNVIKKFSNGDFSVRINDAEEDELGDHARAFDTMADIISNNIDQLEKAEAVRVEMMSLLTHDLRTPITVMRASLESQLMEYDSLSNDERKALLHQALTKCLSLNRLMAQMFELNTIEHRSRTLSRIAFSFNDLVSDVAQEVSAVAEHKGISLQLEIDETEAMVFADIALLERVIRNIIENALRYSTPPGQVYIKCKNQSQSVHFTVVDRGCGIPADELPKIFDAFYRGRNAKQHTSDGTGLGLSISKRILDAHGIRLEVESEMGRGTTVHFEISYQ